MFTPDIYREELIKNLKYCQENRGLEIFAWVIMTNHCHLIVRAKNEDLSDIIRDFKKFTSKKILSLIENNPFESRNIWIGKMLRIDNRFCFGKVDIMERKFIRSNSMIQKSIIYT